MKSIVKIIKYGALFYCLVSILNALVLPPTYELTIDNYLFVFGLANLALVAFKKREYSILVIAFCLFFGWTLVVDFAKHGMDFKSNIPYLLYSLKWPVIIVTLLEASKSGEWSENYPKVIDGLFLTLLGVNLFMLLNIGSTGESMQLLYAPKAYTNFIYYNEFGTFRLAGTQMNANDNAILFCCFYIYYLSFRPKAWHYLLLAFGIIILTQSRTIFLVTLAVSGITAMKHLKVFKSKKQLILFLFGGFLVGITIIFSFSNLRSMFTGKALASSSFMQRVSNLSNALESDGLTLIIGNGVIKNPLLELGAYIDSEFIAVLMQYGLGGILLWMVVLVAINIHFKFKSAEGRYWFLITVLILGASVTNYVFLHGSIGIVLSLFLALSFVGSKEIESKPQGKVQ
ncbi:MAG: hypothetical protein HRT57_08825 [Crocinitomicaceae bacterium]|nr:hypothetical protein [Crocinitomicaceae bacterium]